MNVGGPLLPRVPGVGKIAVLRANALGDLIFALPAFESLRAAYPEAEIVLLGRELHRAAIAGRPAPVDRVEVVPPLPGLVAGERAPETSAQFIERMRRERFDVAIQMHGGGRTSNPLVLELGARVTAGMRTRGAPLLDRWMPYVYFQHEVMRYLELVALLGAPAVTAQPAFPVLPADLAAAGSVTDLAIPYAVLHPGASDPRRRWPAAAFAAVAGLLAEAGLHVVITGTGGEREIVEEVAAKAAGPVGAHLTVAVDRLSVGGLAGLLARSAVVVSNDTGPLHLADATGARTVGIYWCGNLVNGAPLNRSRHRPLASFRSRCPVCGTDCIRESCDHAVSFVTEVTTGEVAEAALELAATVAPPSAVARPA